jgi:hypothetical protein
MRSRRLVGCLLRIRLAEVVVPVWTALRVVCCVGVVVVGVDGAVGDAGLMDVSRGVWLEYWWEVERD